VAARAGAAGRPLAAAANQAFVHAMSITALAAAAFALAGALVALIYLPARPAEAVEPLPADAVSVDDVPVDAVEIAEQAAWAS
jgi:hypothetical protein